MNTKITIHQPKPRKFVIFIALLVIVIPFFLDLGFRGERYGEINDKVINIKHKEEE